LTQRLVITSQEGIRRDYPLEGNRVTIGRSVDNDLSYPNDTGLSRRHLLIEKSGTGWFAEDLRSKNGTLINDNQITGRVPFGSGDTIRLSRMSVVIEGEEAALQKTVVFDAARANVEPPSAHTITLGQLMDREDLAATMVGGLGEQWSDPVTALLRAGRELVARKPPDQLCKDLLDLALEAVGATRGVVMTLEDGELWVRATRGEEIHISTTVRDKVIVEKKSMLVGDVASDDVLRAQQSIVLQRVHSLMAVPLQTDSEVLGLIYVDSPNAWRQFRPEDLNLLTVMANLGAMRIERERLAATEENRKILLRELQQAAEIQREFLPRVAPHIPGLQLAGFNIPCHSVGGDYYDFIPLPNGKVIVVLGDVAGKGMSAALLMVNLQARVQVLTEQPASPLEMVAVLNRGMFKVCPGNRFVTFFLAEIDPDTGTLSFSNAGHNPPMLVRDDGACEMLEGGGPVLGVLDKMPYTGLTCQLQEGDTVTLFSDGVTEAVNEADEEYGEARLEQFLIKNHDLPAKELVSRIHQDVKDFAGNAAQNDDVTIVVVKRVPGDAAEKETARVEAIK